MRQLKFLKPKSKSYGGSLRKKRSGRGERPISTKSTMHLVLRSTKAKGAWSFLQSRNKTKIVQILKKFALKYGVQIISAANVGNHLHLQIRLSNRFTYKPFIRAITGAIAMAVTQTSRWNKLKTQASDRFWDQRPFTRIVDSFKAFSNLRDYVRINAFEGAGVSRALAREILNV